ncbi:Uu.00g125290.m01.CDS01 [Anthostomella pinea]|uniref:Uu.00g125290.m01.CDS01 n=1 Tax=Anthostomella pinea TaxID=933095 RepID=A0AAI8VHR2_9PEZI|nr:Uu.00g125290.m01.CDS01 [Anthostomella pinea]
MTTEPNNPTSNPAPTGSHPPPYEAPSSILIIGSGAFGLSTAWTLTQRPEFSQTRLTILDRSPEPGVFPARDAASIDSSRIIRADYADPAYASLASRASEHWRRKTTNPADDLGREGRYSESGLLLAADAGNGDTVRVLGGAEKTQDGNTDGKNKDGVAAPRTVPTALGYAKRSWVNALALAQREGRPLDSIRMLPSPRAIGHISGTGGEFADWGYLNEGSGWADAERCMDWLYRRVLATNRVEFVNGTAERLETASDGRVTGATMKPSAEDGESSRLSADLVIVAAGAWTPSLLDLQSQAVATGQVLAYMHITEEEQAKLEKIPVLLNMSTGHFIIPPCDGVLKVARHGYGYLNPKTVTSKPLGPHPSSNTKSEPTTTNTSKTDTNTNSRPQTISQPHTHLNDPTLAIPPEGEQDLRRALRRLVPWPALHDRPFFRTRLCWYTDTSTGDWIVDYVPGRQGSIFIATGGSGHAFKFLPVLGDSVVDCIVGRRPPEFADKWAWRGGGGALSRSDGNAAEEDVEESIATEDGSRGGRTGLILQEELDRASHD